MEKFTGARFSRSMESRVGDDVIGAVGGPVSRIDVVVSAIRATGTRLPSSHFGHPSRDINYKIARRQIVAERDQGKLLAAGKLNRDTRPLDLHSEPVRRSIIYPFRPLTALDPSPFSPCNRAARGISPRYFGCSSAIKLFGEINRDIENRGGNLSARSSALEDANLRICIIDYRETGQG